MKLINSSFEIIEQQPGLEGIYKQIELAGRTCYKSEDKITKDSAKKFVDRIKEWGHCYTGNTQVLTDQGWIKFSDYNGQNVAVVNSDMSFKGFETPIQTIRYKYHGIFYNYPEMGITVTDQHNMVGVFKDNLNDFFNNKNYSLFKCNTPYIDNNGRHKTLGERVFKTPRCCSEVLEVDPIYELIGFWIGDGCHQSRKKSSKYFRFRLKKDRKINYLKNLCNLIGIQVIDQKSNYFKVKLNDELIALDVNTNYYSNSSKIIPDIKFSPIQIKSIIIGLINSDGSIYKNTKSIKFSTTSISVLNWIQKNACLAGYVVSSPSTHKNNVYNIHFLNTKSTINNDSRRAKSKVQIFSDVLDVYCVSVSTGIIIVKGENDVISICGNCSVLEHGTVYLKIPHNPLSSKEKYLHKYLYNKYSIVNWDKEKIKDCFLYITTNFRVLTQNNWLDDLQYLCEPTEYHAKRYTVRFVCDRGVSHEFVRHRVFSFAQESTR